MMDDGWMLAGKRYQSRLLVGTGKYGSMQAARSAIIASGAEIITVAVRRVDLSAKGEGSLLEALPPEEYTYLPNTAGCTTAKEAIRTLRLAREMGGWTLVKLEVIGDEKTLYPNVVETINAAETLSAEGFQVMAYTSDDPVAATLLEQAGCAAVMPLAAPIGSGLGILNPLNIKTHSRTGERAGAGRCGHWLGSRCLSGYGAWLRRRAAEHGDCRGAKPAAYGERHAAGSAGWQAGFSGRAHAQAHPCQRQLADERANRVT